MQQPYPTDKITRVQESYLEVNTAYRVLSPLLLSVWFMVEVCTSPHTLCLTSELAGATICAGQGWCLSFVFRNAFLACSNVGLNFRPLYPKGPGDSG